MVVSDQFRPVRFCNAPFFSFTNKETNLSNDSERAMPLSKSNRIVTFYLLTSNARVKGEPAFSRTLLVMVSVLSLLFKSKFTLYFLHF